MTTPLSGSLVSGSLAVSAAGAGPGVAGLKASPAMVSPAIYGGLIRVVETILLAALGYGLAALYVAEIDLASNWQYVATPVLTAVAATSLIQLCGGYAVAALSQAHGQVLRLTAAWLISLGALVASMFFLKSGADVSRVWIIMWIAAGLSGIVGLRIVVQRITRRALVEGRFARRAVVYGTGAHAEAVIHALQADAVSDVRICGVFDDREPGRAPASVAGFANLGTTLDLIAFCRRNAVDMIVVALPLAAEERVERLMRYIRVLPADIRMAAGASTLRFSGHAYSYIGNVPMLDLSDKPISDWGMVGKSMFDKIVAVLALIVLSPLFAAIAMAIKLESRGPVLFRQKRYGFNNDMIEVFKFRSMHTDRCDVAATTLVTRDDPRVTRVGRLIRKTSLDELPQLFNVLTGQLSLVGPRPHAAQAKAADQLYPDVVADYFARHKVKPGITGWAQINGWRGETDTSEKIRQRVAFDLYYIENWSLRFDIAILLRTPLSLLSYRDSAY